MEKLVNQSVKANRVVINKEFVAAQPFRHIAIDEHFEGLEYNPGDSTELTALKNRVAGLRGRIREYENSTSWRITRPLRALKQRLTGRD